MSNVLEIVSKYSIIPHLYLKHLMKFFEIDVKITMIDIVEFSIGRIRNTKNNIGTTMQYPVIPEFSSFPSVALGCLRTLVSNRFKENYIFENHLESFRNYYSNYFSLKVLLFYQLSRINTYSLNKSMNY